MTILWAHTSTIGCIVLMPCIIIICGLIYTLYNGWVDIPIALYKGK